MAVDMNDITARISHWLAMHDIAREGVRVTIEFPTKDATYRAELAIKREVEPYLAHYVTGGGFAEIKQMNGLGLTLRTRTAT